MNEFIFTLTSFLAAIITGLFYNRLLKQGRPIRSSVIQNLPAPTSQMFVGRANEISALHDFLNPENPKTIAGVFGIGGIGKTSLLIEVGRKCISSKSFDVILYIPARQFSLSNDSDISDGILDTIISTAVYALDFKQSKLSDSQKETFVRASFSQKRALLLVDGLDETGEREQNELLNFLLSLPSQTKTIISSRRQIDLPFSIQLNNLIFDEYRTLLSKELVSTNTTELSAVTIKKLYHLTGGLPLAVKWVASLLKDYSIHTVISKFREGSNNLFSNSLFEFSIEPAISKYRKKHPYDKLLITMAHLPNLATLPEIANKAGLADNIQLAEEGLVNLTQVSLLTKSNNKYIMHPLIKEYLLSKERSEH